jgi:hypothetical protein
MEEAVWVDDPLWRNRLAASELLGAQTRRPAAMSCRMPAGRPLAYVYSRDNEAQARQAKMLTKDKARRIAINVARLLEQRID